MNHLTTKRPRGHVPGSVEWLRDIEGPKLVKRLIDEVHANPVGEMTPTGARCASMLLDRALPTLSAVHHTIEGELSQKTTEELIAEFQRLTAQKAFGHEDVTDVTPREKIEVDHGEEDGSDQ